MDRFGSVLSRVLGRKDTYCGKPPGCRALPNRRLPDPPHFFPRREGTVATDWKGFSLSPREAKKGIFPCARHPTSDPVARQLSRVSPICFPLKLTPKIQKPDTHPLSTGAKMAVLPRLWVMLTICCEQQRKQRGFGIFAALPDSISVAAL